MPCGNGTPNFGHISWNILLGSFLNGILCERLSNFIFCFSRMQSIATLKVAILQASQNVSA